MADENAINMFCQLNKKSNFSIFTFKAVFQFSSPFFAEAIYYIFTQNAPNHPQNVKTHLTRSFVFVLLLVFEYEAPDVFSAVFTDTAMSLIFSAL